MHELSIAAAMADLVEDAAARHRANRVRRVKLAVGTLTDVDPDALRFGWEVIAAERTLLADAVLEIIRVAVTVVCSSCGHEGPASPPGVICSACGSDDTRLLTGEELDVTEVELDVPEGGREPEGPV